jgi:branched-subunit amino acid transport protein
MTQQEVILIAGMVLVTFLARYPLLAIVGRVELPKRVFRALRYVPVAVLTAIIVPVALMPDGTLAIHLSNAYLFGSVAGILIAWRTRNLLYTIVGGMAIFFLWRFVLFPV